jgi:meiosis-specific protein
LKQESGIFDAIQKGFLQAIQVTVIVDKSNPQNVLESYTFTFKYKGSLGPLENRLESISLRESGFEANLDTMKTARVGLEMLVRRLIVLSALMPTFPRRSLLLDEFLNRVHTY